MRNLGARIRQMRAEARMSQSDFAKKMGFADHTPISKIENGKLALSAEQLARAAAIFGRDINAFTDPINDSPKTPGERIKAAMQAKGLKYASDLAEMLNGELAEPTVRSYVNGSRPLTPQAAKALSVALDVEWEWLLLGEEVNDVDVKTAAALLETGGKQIKPRKRENTGRLEEINGVETALLPAFDIGLSAGPGSFNSEEERPLFFQPFNHQWLRTVTTSNVEDLVIVHSDGDSMEPTLRAGDQLIIDRAKRAPVRDGVYALRWGDALFVKRLSVDPRNGLLTIGSDNPSHTTYTEVLPDDIDIIGRIVWFGRRL